MPQILSLSMRPRTLSQLFGQESIVKAIRKHQATRPPQAWMFSGASGNGKTTLARILAVAYNCTHQKPDLWGDPCEECWKNQEKFSIHEINASGDRGVEEMEKITQLSQHRPMNCAKRVFIMDESQKLSASAQNLLLKPLEEPPAYTIWIICTTEPSKILKTVQRRLTSYQLKSLNFDGTEKFLAHYAKTAGITKPLTDLCEQAHLAQMGSPGLLLQALEKFGAGSSALEAVANVGDLTATNSLAVCKGVTSGNWNTVKALLKDAGPEDARYIRASVSGWLRGFMLRETNSRLLDRAATSLQELCAQAPYEDNMMLLWLWSVLYKITARYGAKAL